MSMNITQKNHYHSYMYTRVDDTQMNIDGKDIHTIRQLLIYTNLPTWPQVSRFIWPVVQLNTWILDGLSQV